MISMKVPSKSINCIIFLVVYLISNACYSSGEMHTETLSYAVCFTPQENCTNVIVDKIDHAKKSVYVQAYSFTSLPIIRALILAKKRGVDVKVILDKTQIQSKRYKSASFFRAYKIPLWIDNKPAIAHNKVMIIDGSLVITGSFNFTKAAQYKNSENVLIIESSRLAGKYMDNWNSRAGQSWVVAQ